MWFLSATQTNPLPGIGTDALVTALCVSNLATFAWLRSVVNARNADKDQVIERIVPSLTHTAEVLERVVQDVRRLDDSRGH